MNLNTYIQYTYKLNFLLGVRKCIKIYHYHEKTQIFWDGTLLPTSAPLDAFWLVHTAEADKTKLSCLVRVGGVNKLLHCSCKLETGSRRDKTVLSATRRSEQASRDHHGRTRPACGHVTMIARPIDGQLGTYTFTVGCQCTIVSC